MEKSPPGREAITPCGGFSSPPAKTHPEHQVPPTGGKGSGGGYGLIANSGYEQTQFENTPGAYAANQQHYPDEILAGKCVEVKAGRSDQKCDETNKYYETGKYKKSIRTS